MRDLPPRWFPLWQIDQDGYATVCRYLGVTPKAEIYERICGYLSTAPFRVKRPSGFALFLSRSRLTPFRVARLGVASRWLPSDVPFRHVVNAVIALHECDRDGYRELSATPHGPAVLASIAGWMAAYAWRTAATLPWLGGMFLLYAAGKPFRRDAPVQGEQVLITGVNRGLGWDLMLECLERGARVIGTVRSSEIRDELAAKLPRDAPVVLLVADLSRAGALVEALEAADIAPDALRAAILNAGVKHDQASVLSLPSVVETFQINCFSAIEFARWFCSPGRRAAPGGESGPGRRALVLISSMGRWHGMGFGGAYNASKAALSIWAESLEMELRKSRDSNVGVTIVEPGIFDSGMTRGSPLSRMLFVSRRAVAHRIVSGALSGARTIRPPGWFALMTWAACLAGRNVRYKLFAKARGDSP